MANQPLNRHGQAAVIAADGLPLSFRVAPIKGFLEVGLAADQSMTAVEVQLVDAGSGPTIIVLVHRPDRSIDVAVSDHRLDEDWFRQDPCMCHMPLGRITTASFQRDHFRIDDRSVEVDVSLDAEHLPGRLEIAARHRFSRPGRPTFVPAVPGTGERPTLRLILAGAVRGLPRSADLVITHNGNRLELAPLMRVGPIVLARQARLGRDVLGLGLNLSGTVHVPRLPSRAEGNEDEPFELTVARGRHRLAMRLLSTAGAPVRQVDFPRSGHAPGTGHVTRPANGRFVIDGSLGPVVTGNWQLEADQSGVTLTLDDVTQQWSPGWTDPVGMARDMARRRRRAGERWQWSGRWQGGHPDINIDTHTGQWAVHGTA